MQELTRNQQTVMSIVRRQCRLGDPVATRDVRDIAAHRGVSSSATRGALDALARKGLIVKTAPGCYLPADPR